MTRGRKSLLFVLSITSTSEVAARCRVSVSTIEKLRSGERAPSNAVVSALEEQYGIKAVSWREKTSRPPVC